MVVEKEEVVAMVVVVALAEVVVGKLSGQLQQE